MIKWTRPPPSVFAYCKRSEMDSGKAWNKGKEDPEEEEGEETIRASQVPLLWSLSTHVVIGTSVIEPHTSESN